jgi:RimJ/RimL family protein N-acetyltransferase
MRWLPRHVYLHDVAVLVCRNPHAGVLQVPHLRTKEWLPSHSDPIMQLHQQLAHRMTPQRLAQRFGNGLRYFALYAGDTPIGSTWAAVGTARYVDELNWLLPILPTEFWVRDVFLSPAWRGKGLFPALLRLLAEHHVPGCTAAWSDVDWPNAQSMRAHRNAGFEVYTRARTFDIAGRLRLRSPLPSWHLPVLEMNLSQRLLWLRNGSLQRHKDLLA